MTSWLTCGKQILLRVFQHSYEGAWGELLAAGELRRAEIHSFLLRIQSTNCIYQLPKGFSLQPINLMWTVYTSSMTVGLETNIRQVTDQKYLQIRVKTKMEQLPAVHNDKHTHSMTESLIQEGLCNGMTGILCGED